MIGAAMNHEQMLKPMLIGGAALVVLGALGVPVLAYAPLLILLVCPLMMIFMMRGMGHSGGHGEAEGHGREHDDSDAGPRQEERP
jgi:fatty acid desaturase